MNTKPPQSRTNHDNVLANGGTLTPSEAALVLRVRARTLVRWEALGVICPHRTPGGHRRYTLPELLAIFDRRLSVVGVLAERKG
jgi:predicted site-specific integrase-resolvase